MTEAAGTTEVDRSTRPRRPARVLDVSGLPDHGHGTRATPVWWGNTLLIFIETTTMVLLLVAYFYIRRNFTAVAAGPVQHAAAPVPPAARPAGADDRNWSLIVLSCLPMYWTDMAARTADSRRVVAGLWLMFAVAVAAIVLRFFEFPGLHFRWDDNAYGSITWTILGMHLTYLLAQAAEFFIMALYLMRHPLDPKHGLDVTLAGGYWYWVAATWVAAYATVYLGSENLMTSSSPQRQSPPTSPSTAAAPPCGPASSARRSSGPFSCRSATP